MAHGRPGVRRRLGAAHSAAARHGAQTLSLRPNGSSRRIGSRQRRHQRPASDPLQARKNLQIVIGRVSFALFARYAP
jgi:hypothetical protein